MSNERSLTKINSQPVNDKSEEEQAINSEQHPIFSKDKTIGVNSQKDASKPHKHLAKAMLPFHYLSLALVDNVEQIVRILPRRKRKNQSTIETPKSSRTG